MTGKTCTECGREAVRLRRDRCDACYMRLYRGGELPERAACASCGERRRDLLALAELGGQETVLCGNCGLVLARTRPRLTALAELVRRTCRERRSASERRVAPASACGIAVDRRVAPRRDADQKPVGPTLDPAID